MPERSFLVRVLNMVDDLKINVQVDQLERQ